MIILKSRDEIESMRKAGELVARCHQLVAENIRPGVTTKFLDQIVEDLILQEQAIPAFKGYQGYPATICASINNVVVHGIPNDLVLEEGWILGVDIGAFVEGFCGDSAWTYPVGAISPEAQKLLDVTEKALFAGIENARVGNRLSDISNRIQTVVEENGFSVVRDFVGHGIGREMHEAPQIPNFGIAGRGPRLKAGMTLAIEPMVNVGNYHVQIQEDNWTVVTVDNSLSAHFEHTVAITENGPEILTVL